MVVGLGLVFGSLVGGLTGSALGRKQAICIYSVVNSAACLLLAFATNSPTILALCALIGSLTAVVYDTSGKRCQLVYVLHASYTLFSRNLHG